MSEDLKVMRGCPHTNLGSFLLLHSNVVLHVVAGFIIKQ